MSAEVADAPTPGPMGSRSVKLISCVLSDDGTERRLLRWLRDQGITGANSVYCRGHSVLREAKARRGKLPEPEWCAWSPSSWMRTRRMPSSS